MSRTRIDLKESDQWGEFALILGKILENKFSRTRKNPISESMAELAALSNGSNGESRQATDKRLWRKVDHLLKAGYLDFSIDEEKLHGMAREFYQEKWLSIKSKFDNSQVQIVKFLRERKKVIIKSYPDTARLYKDLNNELAEKLVEHGASKVLVGQGNTISELARHFADDHSVEKSKGGPRAPIFLPASGNFSAKDPLSTEESQYFYLQSANNSATRFNGALNRSSYFLDTPAIIEVPVEDKAGKKLSDDVIMTRLKTLKEYFQCSQTYRSIYPPRQDKVAAGIGTILFSIGSPFDSKSGAAVTYSSFLKKYDGRITGLKDTNLDLQEILLRFYLNGKLIGDEDIHEPQLGGTREQVFNLLYYCYLGLKMKVCSQLAKNSTTAKGLGSVIVAKDEIKIPSVLLAISQPDPVANRVYMLQEHIPRLVEAMDTYMPIATKKEYQEWCAKNPGRI